MYVQESGIAGRDGQLAYGLLLADFNDQRYTTKHTYDGIEAPSLRVTWEKLVTEDNGCYCRPRKYSMHGVGNTAILDLRTYHLMQITTNFSSIILHP